MSVRKLGTAGKCCFAIPGWGEDSGSFLPLEPHLQDKAQIYAVDPPGYGTSTEPSPFSLPRITELLKEAFDQASAESSSPIQTIVGNCSGAILAAELALAMDTTPQRMVLIDPFAFLPGYFKVFLRRGFGRAAYQSTFANPVGRWLTNRFAGGRGKAETDMTSTFKVVNHEVTYKYLKIFGEHQGISKFSGLRCKVTIITGERTFAAVRKSIEMWQKLWPSAQVTELSGTGHLPIREAPADLVAAMFPLRQGEEAE
jgi:pimeloyl-ACP methyl ester carboxylesterase